MKFGEKLRALRQNAGLTQSELAAKIGVSARTLINYEQGRCYPKSGLLYSKLASVFSVDAGGLIDEADEYIKDAAERGGASAARDMDALLSEMKGLFSGGELSDEDRDNVMRTINEMYWSAKEKNKSKK